MAAVPPAGGQSPTSFSRTLERVFEEAQHTGEINLSGRKLKEYPKVSAKYDLGDSTLTGRFLQIWDFFLQFQFQDLPHPISTVNPESHNFL